MRNLFDLKGNHDNPRNNYILNLYVTSSCRNGTQALYFKEVFFGMPFQGIIKYS